MLRVLDIIPGTIVDGPGLRTSIYFAGCSHHCPGCHNPQSWPIDAGREMSVDELLDIVAEYDTDVTFTGGDPFVQAEEVAELARRLKAEQGRGIWCYTGYLYEQILADARLSVLLDSVDVLVDGRFDGSLRDISLSFRGSSNQRLIDVNRSRGGRVVEWCDNLEPF